MEVQVKAWMSGDPISIDADASALEAVELMSDRGIRHLPVLDAQRRVVGVVTVDDLRAALPLPLQRPRALSPTERSWARELRVGEVMVYAPRTVRADEPLERAADSMAEWHIGCMPVVDDAGYLVGILTETDALHALAAALHAERIPERHPERQRERELEELVAALRSERARIADRLDGYHGAERELSADAHDQPMDALERSADLRETHTIETLDELAARRLESLDRALDHAVQGRLSICDGCGGTIPLARLRALPGTTLCVACARAAEGRPEPGEPFERVPGGRAQTGRPELGAQVYTRFGEGQLLRVVPLGTCRRCGDVEGFRDAETDEVVCGSEGCAQPLEGVRERAIVRVGEREVYVDPAELRSVSAAPYD
jgi:acetoin utilization protein AcuB